LDKAAVEPLPILALGPRPGFSTRLFMTALILASGSSIRRQMLKDAGVEFEIVRPDVDEDAAKAGQTEPGKIAVDLAQAKAVAVSASRPDDWVIGSDSVVAARGQLFNKPASRAEAAEHLRFFSGKMMQLTSGVALAQDGRVDWSHVETAELYVRDLSDAFIDSYLDAEWPEVGYTVGVFRMEARGVQLFDRIAGDHFTILGMPLIPLLSALRQRGILQS
jgi:septum formation protein